MKKIPNILQKKVWRKKVLSALSLWERGASILLTVRAKVLFIAENVIFGVSLQKIQFNFQRPFLVTQGQQLPLRAASASLGRIQLLEVRKLISNLDIFLCI